MTTKDFKIIHLVNNYQMEWYSEDGGSGSGVFNGDIGYITYIDKSAPSMKVDLFLSDKALVCPWA